MKKFTCKEIMNGEGGCAMVFEDAEMMDVASQCGKHIAGTTDETHKPMRDMITSKNHTEEEKKRWFEWFAGEWNKKKDE